MSRLLTSGPLVLPPTSALAAFADDFDYQVLAGSIWRAGSSVAGFEPETFASSGKGFTGTGELDLAPPSGGADTFAGLDWAGLPCAMAPYQQPPSAGTYEWRAQYVYGSGSGPYVMVGLGVFDPSAGLGCFIAFLAQAGGHWQVAVNAAGSGGIAGATQYSTSIVPDANFHTFTLNTVGGTIRALVDGVDTGVTIANSTLTWPAGSGMSQPLGPLAYIEKPAGGVTGASLRLDYFKTFRSR